MYTFWRLRSLHMRLIAAAAAILSALALSAVANAYTTANPTENHAIASTLRAAFKVGHGSCMDHDVYEYLGADISSTDAHYALGRTRDNGCTFAFGAFVYRSSTSSERWKVVAYESDSATPCSYFSHRLPASVIREFRLRGIVGNSNDLVACH